MAEFVSAHWPEYMHPIEYGDIVNFDRLVIAARDAGAWPIIIDGMQKQFGKTVSLYVLKAFPLEFEASDHMSDSREFHRRQKAMKRLYHRILNFTEVEGEHADWMWRATKGVVDEAFSRDWLPEELNRQGFIPL
ncbi:hypothetical protein GUK36_22535 [Rhizobium leguminosarum]|uniref:Uncharacterized protein n=1 Tax=Rhizobium leguminosarum TaxID=384 RepID=A0A6P0DIS8_RHILE|nr:hypothetical protein [Rhizobium leguminosarum]NEK52207.1 hypothetical protein [Rhizobium leguminosarum]